jgi:FtsP/CotA-like multicopper oxidase with cupredoxin domain
MSSFSRRGFLHVCGLGAAALALPACGDDVAALPDGAVVTGDFTIPPLLDGELVGDTRVFRLQLRTGSVEWVTGAPTATYGANGDVLGPTLHFRRGERVRIEVTNDLGVTTTLHWHGLQLPSRADGGPYQTIAAGTTWVSEYDVIQRAMTAWYHPHQMHETARHVYMGLAGLIIIEDPVDAAVLPSTYGVDDLPLIIQDKRLLADGSHPYSAGKTPTMHDHMSGMRGETMMVNGRITPRTVVPRGLVRLRVVNGSNARIYNLGFADNRSFLHIASDGGLLSAPLSTTRVLLAPGERAELLVDFGSDAEGAATALRSFSGEVFATLYTGMMGANMTDALDRGTFDLMTFEAGPPPQNALPAPTAFTPIDREPEAEAVRTRSITLSMAMGTWLINGTTMTQIGNVPSAINFQIAAGDVEIWELVNSSNVAHPIHLHNRHFQVLTVGGQPPPPSLAGWKDTVIVAPGQLVRILVRFEGTPDPEVPYMFHCHILEHEDMGMMGQFFLVAP